MINYTKNETNIEFKEETLFENTIRFQDYNIKIHKGTKLGKGTKIMENVVIRENAIIGEDCIVGNGSLIRENAQLGDNVKIGFSCSIETNAKVGNGTNIQGFSMICEFSQIGKGCFFGPFFCNPADNDISNFEGEYKPNPAIIGNNVRIGAKVTLKPAISIGNNVVIGMSSLVTKNVPDNEMWYGSPAKQVIKQQTGIGDSNGNKQLRG